MYGFERTAPMVQMYASGRDAVYGLPEACQTLIHMTTRTRATKTFPYCALRMIPSGWSGLISVTEKLKTINSLLGVIVSEFMSKRCKRPGLLPPPKSLMSVLWKPSRSSSFEADLCQHVGNLCRFSRSCDVFPKAAAFTGWPDRKVTLNVPLRSHQTETDMNKPATTKMTGWLNTDNRSSSCLYPGDGSQTKDMEHTTCAC